VWAIRPHWDTACAPGVRGRNQTKTQANKTQTRPRGLIRERGHVTTQNILNPDPQTLTPSLSYTVAELPRSYSRALEVYFMARAMWAIPLVLLLSPLAQPG